MKCGKQLFNPNNSTEQGVNYALFYTGRQLADSVEDLARQVIDKLVEANKVALAGDATDDEEAAAINESLPKLVNQLVTLYHVIASNLKSDPAKSVYLLDNAETFKDLITRELIDQPSEQTEADENAIEGLKSITEELEEKRAALNLRKTELAFFGSNRAAALLRSRQFKSDLTLRAILDRDNDRVIDSVEDLNQGLQAYKAAQYKAIYDFLKSKGLEKGLSSSYYRESKNGEINAVSTADKALAVLYRYATEMPQGQLDAWVDLGWQAKLRNETNQYSQFVDALYAYINLEHFDTHLQDALGEVIQIDTKLAEPINSIVDDETKAVTQVYKYSYGKSYANKITSWGADEIRNAISETGKFSTTVVEAIPLIQWETKGQSLHRNLNVVHFATAFTNLFDALHKLNAGSSVSSIREVSKAALTFHEHGVDSITTILKTIFNGVDATVSKETALIKALKDTGHINNFDLNVLRSVWEFIYNPKVTAGNKNSVWAIEQKHFKQKGRFANFPITYAITGLIDRTMSMNYVETVWDTSRARSRMRTRIKRKFPNSKNTFDTVEAINGTTASIKNKDALTQEFGFQMDNEVSAWIKVGDQYYHFDANSSPLGLLTKQARTKIRVQQDLSNLLKIDLNDINVRRTLLSGSGLTADQAQFLNLLKMFDKLLLTGFSSSADGLRRLAVFQDLYGQSWLNDLMVSAMQVLLVNDINSRFNNSVDEAGNKFPPTALKEQLKNLYGQTVASLTERDAAYKTIFMDKINGSQLKAVYSGLDWIDALSDTEAIVSGEVSKAVTKNLSGDNVANYSPAFLGSQIHYELSKQKEDPESAASNLLFALGNNSSNIISTVIDTDVRTRIGTVKAVKAMSQGELLYHAIVDKFISPQFDIDGNLLGAEHRRVIIQPTTYSDKTKFVNYMISCVFKDASGNDIDLLACSEEAILRLMHGTVGQAYHTIYNSVLSDYIQIFGDAILNDGVKPLMVQALQGVQNPLITITENADGVTLYTIGQSTFTKADLVKEVVKSVSISKLNNLLRTHNEESFTALAQSRGVTVYKDTHYRKLPGGLSMNELLYEQCQNLYAEGDIEVLAHRLEDEKKAFVEALLQNRVVFKTNLSENPSAYNDITRALIKETGSADAAADWVSGINMIIAKVVDSAGNVVRVVKNGQKINLAGGQRVILNPVLNRYFNVSALVNNNLRFSLTGSEINHKVKALEKGNFSLGAGISKALSDEAKATLKGFNILDSKGKLIKDFKTLGLNELNVALQNMSGLVQASGNPESFVGFNELLDVSRHLTWLDKYLDGCDHRNASLSDIAEALNRAEKEIAIAESQTQNLLTPGENIETLKAVNAQKASYNYINRLYKDLIYRVESAAQMAQLKRNVIIPATMQYYLQDCFNGIGKTMRVAVINDLKAEVFNFSGEVSAVDAHDGSGLLNNLTSILENNSLQDQAVGTIKKPIWHHYDAKHMTSSLVKYAADTITQQWMRQSVLSTCSLYELNKRMNNIQWTAPGVFSKEGTVIDLLYCEHKADRTIDFITDILDGNRLYYQTLEKGGVKAYKEITGFGRDTVTTADGNSMQVYYTTEQVVDIEGNLPDPEHPKTEKVYHLFDADSNHIAIRTVGDEISQIPAGLHTINSLFELQESLGGIYSMSKYGDQPLQLSEASSYAVVNFMNSVTFYQGTVKKAGNLDEAGREIKKDRWSDAKEFTQKTYYQPLKEALIDYALNDSAIKNGAGNMNGREAFNADFKGPLRYITLSTTGYGIQMDADHVADEAHMTEFSQVISSLDAGGRIHSYVAPIYEVLGQITMEECALELEAMDSFRASNNLSELYDVVGRTILEHFSKGGSSDAGLTDKIIKTVAQKFNLNINHVKDKWKIPFSDPNIYSQILSTYVSIINKKAIKKQYPGSGTVMAPGYNISMIFKIGGQPYMFEDLLEKAKSDTQILAQNPKSDTESWTSYWKRITQAYLAKMQEQEQVYDTVESFSPTDIVDTGYLDADGKFVLLETQDLSAIKAYYGWKIANGLFSDPPLEAAGRPIVYRQNVTRARNLAPVRVRFSYDGGTRSMNIFDHHAIRDMFLSGKRNPKVAQQVFDLLDKGIYIDENGKKYEDVEIIENSNAELIVSNMFMTKFGNTVNQSLAEIRSSKLGFTIPRVIPKQHDIVFTKNDGKHVYVTFDSTMETTRDADGNVLFQAKALGWGNNIKREVFDEYPEDYTGPRNIVHRIYALDENGKKSFEIGRDLIRDDVKYREDENGKDIFYTIGEDGREQIVEGFFALDGDQVLETVYFLKKYKTTERISSNKKTFNYRYETYNVNMSALARVFPIEVNDTKTEGVEGTIYAQQQMQSYVGKNILGSLYNSDNFLSIQTANTYSKTRAAQSFGVLKALQQSVSNNRDLANYLGAQLSLLSNAIQNAKDDIVSIDSKLAIKEMGGYLDRVSYSRKASFMKSLQFIASRIPAQTHQSFMKMSCVGFSGSDKNVCYVSHWQTWLQGSDYDIDKAYIMGHNFDANGRYIGWSNAFDYSSIALLEASERLPMPRDIVFTTQEHLDSKLLKDGNDYKQVSLKQTAELFSSLNAYNEASIELRAFLQQERELKQRIDALKAERVKLKKLKDEASAATVQQITEQLNALRGQKVDLEKYKLAKLKALTNLLNVIYEQNKELAPEKGVRKVVVLDTLPNISEEILNELLKDLRRHETTKIPESSRQGALRNFISSHIEGTISNIRNLVGAYSPISMDDIGDAAATSPKGDASALMTLMNPAVVYQMQYQNMTGKNVIGIAANGEKGSFMLHFYYNDLVSQAVPEADTAEMQEYLTSLQLSQFSIKTSRIRGRATGETLIEEEITALPDVNLDLAKPEAMQYLEQYGYTGRLNPSLPVDLMISQILSAATDNAKELILDKINAGSKLAKVYLYLITIGMDINDIVKFMTSEAVSYIDNLTESNIFNESVSISEKDAITILRTGRIPDRLLKSIYKSIGFRNEDGRYVSLQRTLGGEFDGAWSLSNLQTVYGVSGAKSTEKIQLAEPQNADEAKLIQMFNDVIENILSGRPVVDEEVKADLVEFENALSNAQEFTNFTRLLGLNQGIPTKKEELDGLINLLENIMSSAKRKDTHPFKGVDDNNALTTLKTVFDEDTANKINDLQIATHFSGKRWLADEEYRKYTSLFYDKIKGFLNIFEVVPKLPHYKAMLAVADNVVTMDSVISVKSAKYDEIASELRTKWKIFPGTNKFKRVGGQILNFIDAKLAVSFFKNYLDTYADGTQGVLRFPIKKGQTYLNALAKDQIAVEDGYIDLNTPEGLATFKYLMETEVLPGLKENPEDLIPELRRDPIKAQWFRDFQIIRDLIPDSNKDVPYYKLNIDMSNLNNTETSEVKFQQYLGELQRMKGLTYGDHSILDWLMLYNLYVHKNNYGRDRMTKLFEDFIGKRGNQDNILNTYLHYVGELDYARNSDILNYTIKDFLIFIAPFVTDPNDSELPYVKLQDPDGRIKVWDNVNGQEATDAYPALHEDISETISRMVRYQQYFLSPELVGSNLAGIDFVFTAATTSQATAIEVQHLLDLFGDFQKQGLLLFDKLCV